MKKILALIISVCYIFNFVGCGQTADNSNHEKTSKSAEESKSSTAENASSETEDANITPEVTEPITVDGSQQAKTIGAGCCFVAIREDGTIAKSGCERCDTSTWTDINQIVAPGSSVVGLKSDGTVLTTSPYSSGQEVTSWSNITQISGGLHHTVGLKSDGTVVSTHLDTYDAVNKGQTDVASWTDIVAISASTENTIGLKSDGTVVAAGVAYSKLVGTHDFEDVYFNQEECTTISTWTDIVAISSSNGLLAGLKSDGTVVLAGDIADLEEVKDWKNIVAIDANGYSLIGIKADGSVIATNMDLSSIGNDFVAVDDGGIGTILLKSDGTVKYLYDSKRNTIDHSIFADTKFKTNN